VREHNAALVLSLYRRYSGELLSFLTAKLGCRDQAGDVVQETYVRVLSLENPQAILQPRAFLYKTALNLTIDAFRHRRLCSERTVELETVEHLPSQQPDQEAVVDSKQRVEILRRAIDELPPKCRHVFLLHKFQSLPHAAIAERLGISKNMVEKHVMKAMAHCRKRLYDLAVAEESAAGNFDSQVRVRSSVIDAKGTI
jgi:RNA polymerase sigma-70 factor (ECF subfamily)